MTPLFIERLSDNDESTRALAAEDAGFDEDRSAIDPLFARLEIEPSRFVCEAIVGALERIRDPKVSEHARKLFASDDAFFRNAAVSILQKQGEIALASLRAAFDGGNIHQRKLALDAAATIIAREADEFLALGLRDSDINVRICALEHVGDRELASLLPFVKEMLATEADPMLLSTVLQSLDSIGDPSVLSVLLRRFPTVDDVPNWLLSSWLRLIARWGDPGTIDTLLSSVGRVGAAGIGDLVDCLEILQDRFALNDLTPINRECVCQMIVMSEGPTRLRLGKWIGGLAAARMSDSEVSKNSTSIAYEVLMGIVEDPDPITRQSAVVGLRQVVSPGCRAKLVERLCKESNPQIKAILGDALEVAWT